MPTAQKYALQAGDLRNMKRQEFEPTAPQPSEVRVAVTAIGLNFADIFAIWGLYGATPKGEFTPGLEYAGRIDAVGEGVTSVRVGDRVQSDRVLAAAPQETR